MKKPAKRHWGDSTGFLRPQSGSIAPAATMRRCRTTPPRSQAAAGARAAGGMSCSRRRRWAHGRRRSRARCRGRSRSTSSPVRRTSSSHAVAKGAAPAFSGNLRGGLVTGVPRKGSLVPGESSLPLRRARAPGARGGRGRGRGVRGGR